MNALLLNLRLACRTWVSLAMVPGLALTASAAEFVVGPGHYATLQDAVDAAADAGNLEAENIIVIAAPVIHTAAAVQIGAQFNADKQLVLRPDTAGGMSRATVVSENGFEPIVLVVGASHVTLQDLDLVRHTTNNDHLLQIVNGTSNVVERCRIGTDWTSPGLGEWSHVQIESPVEVVVRNCICFAHLPGNLARGINVVTGTAQNHSIYLYNNTVADFGLCGIDISGSGSVFLLLRNNVVLNDLVIDPEPAAYHSHVDELVEVEASHNTAFASAAHVELLDIIGGGLAQSIAGAEGLMRLERHEAGMAFREFEWKLDQGWNANLNLFRLRHGGLLHREASDAGQDVRNGQPHWRDQAVDQDWELDPRHTGDPPRNDRGADQFQVLIAGDIEVFLPRISVFAGMSLGHNGADEFEIVTVGPQEDLPDQWETMSGGEYGVSGAFVSIGTPQLAGFYELRLVPSSSPDNDTLLLAWPTTVRPVSVQATKNLAEPDSWTTVSALPAIDGDTTWVALPITGPQRFFRLRY